MDPLGLGLLIAGAIAGAASVDRAPTPQGWGYGVWTPQMVATAGQVFDGALVIDLGAGPEVVASKLAAMQGAHAVMAVDQVPMTDPGIPSVETWTGTFSGLLPYMEQRIASARAQGIPVTSIVSWPTNQGHPNPSGRPTPALIEVLKQSDYIVYRGHNFGGTACGSAALYAYLMTRPLYAVIEHPNNTLIIYRSGRVDRAPIPEEIAGYQNATTYDITEFKDRRSLTR